MGELIEERLARIEEKIDQITYLTDDVESLKEFKWKLVGWLAVVIPLYTAIVTDILINKWI
jgi:hypothetical protein